MSYSDQWSVRDASPRCIVSNSFGEFDFVVYKLVSSSCATAEIFALSIGPIRDDIVVRINSACITSEVFGDTNCDCGWQLRRSMEIFATEKSGLLIYNPSEEGRGVGIFAKAISISKMQADKVSSSTAFRAAGLPVDARNYKPASALLQHFGLQSVKCLTNNPKKVEAIRAVGIEVSSVIPLVIPNRPDLRGLLLDKLEQGHDIDLGIGTQTK